MDNELETYGTTTYTYNANGAVTKKTSGETVSKFFYNTENRLEKVVDQDGTVIAQYGYDPFDRRIWKEVDGTRTWFLYCDQGLAGEYDANGTLLRSYGYKPGSAWTSDPLFMKVGATYYWCYNDRAGTTKMIRSSLNFTPYGEWVGKYQAFGACTVTTEALNFNLRFAGQYYDAETGLHYNGHRYYDPETGRYLRPDPAGGGINFYAYASNNPVMFIDPLGLCPESPGWGAIVPGIWEAFTNDRAIEVYKITGIIVIATKTYVFSKAAIIYGGVNGYVISAGRYPHGGGGINLLQKWDS